jgi:hypothetical protein
VPPAVSCDTRSTARPVIVKLGLPETALYKQGAEAIIAAYRIP